MIPLIPVLIALVLLELLLLVGLVFAWFKLNAWQQILLDSRLTIFELRSLVSRRMKAGETVAHMVAITWRTLEGQLPWWLKLGFRMFGSLAKIKQQTS